MNWYDGFEPILRHDVPLCAHTWFHLGGPARWLASPRDETELAALVGRAAAADVPWRVLGRGANVLVRDGGFPGLVIRLEAPAFSGIEFGAQRRPAGAGKHGEHRRLAGAEIEIVPARGQCSPSFDSADVDSVHGESATINPSNIVRAGAGADFPKFIRDTLTRGLLGLEALAGVPGTVGGLVRMNAGGKYGETGQFVRTVRVLDKDRQIADLSHEQVGFRYRHTDLEGCIVLSATFELTPGDASDGLARHKTIWTEKHKSQPAVAQRSAGCIFKNPPGGSAGRLIDQAGLKNTRVGGATISPKHANFILASDSATAQNVIDLIGLAKDRVAAAAGIMLETEIEIW